MFATSAAAAAQPVQRVGSFGHSGPKPHHKQPELAVSDCLQVIESVSPIRVLLSTAVDPWGRADTSVRMHTDESCGRRFVVTESPNAAPAYAGGEVCPRSCVPRITPAAVTKRRSEAHYYDPAKAGWAQRDNRRSVAVHCPFGAAHKATTIRDRRKSRRERHATSRRR